MLRPKLSSAWRSILSCLIAVAVSPIGTFETAVMSAVRQLSGVNRTWRGQPNLVENDPKRTVASKNKLDAMPVHRVYPHMSKIKAVCVYCGSSPGHDVAYVEAGERLGRALAASGLTLIYGGGTHGVMGAVARGALNNGGKVGAIIPRFLINWETTTDALKMFEDLTITDTMHERKHLMFERSDAFVALPGGIGTVEEIVEIMTWAQLGQHRKPIVLVNIKGFWAPMMAMLDHIRSVGFLHRDHLLQPIIVDHADDVIPAIVAAAAKNRASEDGVSSIIDKM